MYADIYAEEYRAAAALKPEESGGGNTRTNTNKQSDNTYMITNTTTNYTHNRIHYNTYNAAQPTTSLLPIKKGVRRRQHRRHRGRPPARALHRARRDGRRVPQVARLAA